MRLRNTIEILYLTLMTRWQKSAPPDGKQGLLDDVPERNTQISRMVYLLRKVALGEEERTYNTLARYSRRQDGESYISKNSAWMEEPRELSHGWFFEGCTSLAKKQDILQGLTHVGFSPAFVACADDFVAGKCIESFYPTKEEAEDILARIRD